mgnify:CR=1 FL=1
MSDAVESPVLFSELDSTNGKKIGLATLNMPKTLNSLSLEMCELLTERFTAWQADDAIAAVFLDASGEKAFCAGGDVQQLYKSAVENPGGPCSYAETFFEVEYALDYLIHTYSKPIVCWGHGIVMGGGLGLICGASHKVVTEKSRVAMPEITIALYPDVGGTYFLNRMPGKTGLFIALTGASINAADMLYTGIAGHFSAQENKQNILDALSAVNWQGELAADSTAIDALFTEECPLESKLEEHRSLIDELCQGDSLSGIVDRIVSLDSDDSWLSKARDTLAAGSPVAANTIWQQHLKGTELSLAEIFQYELVLSTNVVRHPEFAEGVRALLIDKDRNPKWAYDSVDAVPASLMEQFQTPPWNTNPLAGLGNAG